MQKTCDVAGMSFLANKNWRKIWPKNGLKLPKMALNCVLSLRFGEKSKKLAEILSPETLVFGCMLGGPPGVPGAPGDPWNPNLGRLMISSA